MTRTPSWIALACIAIASVARAEDTVPPPTWTLSTLYNYSSLSDDRGDWNEGALELLGRATQDLTLGVHVDVRDRSNGTDELYGVLASYAVTPKLEVHGLARFSPSPNFS